MPKLERGDLNYRYNWTVTAGDNPKLIADDANHLSRNEGYEMLHYLNTLTGQGGSDLPKRSRLIVEWMLKEHFKSTAPGRQTVTSWVAENFTRLEASYPY